MANQDLRSAFRMSKGSDLVYRHPLVVQKHRFDGLVALVSDCGHLLRPIHLVDHHVLLLQGLGGRDAGFKRFRYGEPLFSVMRCAETSIIQLLDQAKVSLPCDMGSCINIDDSFEVYRAQ